MTTWETIKQISIGQNTWILLHSTDEHCFIKVWYTLPISFYRFSVQRDFCVYSLKNNLSVGYNLDNVCKELSNMLFKLSFIYGTSCLQEPATEVFYKKGADLS